MKNPRRRPARRRTAPALSPDRVNSVSSSSAGSVGGGGSGGAAGLRVFGAATLLLGGDEVAIVRLAAVDDLDLGAIGRRPDLAGDRLGLGEGRV